MKSRKRPFQGVNWLLKWSFHQLSKCNYQFTKAVKWLSSKNCGFSRSLSGQLENEHASWSHQLKESLSGHFSSKKSPHFRDLSKVVTSGSIQPAYLGALGRITSCATFALTGLKRQRTEMNIIMSKNALPDKKCIIYIQT